MRKFTFTSESVTEGHPDKVCDRISDAVVDAFIGLDPYARVACETLVTTNYICIAGEVRLDRKKCGAKAPMLKNGDVNAKVIEALARNAVRDIGYEQKGFHWEKAKYACYLHGQSAHIAQGVDASDKKDEGAGDQRRQAERLAGSRERFQTFPEVAVVRLILAVSVDQDADIGELHGV